MGNACTCPGELSTTKTTTFTQNENKLQRANPIRETVCTNSDDFDLKTEEHDEFPFRTQNNYFANKPCSSFLCSGSEESVYSKLPLYRIMSIEGSDSFKSGSNFSSKKNSFESELYSNSSSSESNKSNTINRYFSRTPSIRENSKNVSRTPSIKGEPVINKSSFFSEKKLEDIEFEEIFRRKLLEAKQIDNFPNSKLVHLKELMIPFPAENDVESMRNDDYLYACIDKIKKKIKGKYSVNKFHVDTAEKENVINYISSNYINKVKDFYPGGDCFIGINFKLAECGTFVIYFLYAVEDNGNGN